MTNRGDAAAATRIYQRRRVARLRYERIAQLFGFASLDLSSLTQSVCILPWLDYIDRLEWSTMWPIALIALMCVAYNVLKRIYPASPVADWNKWIYTGMLLAYPRPRRNLLLREIPISAVAASAEYPRRRPRRRRRSRLYGITGTSYFL